MLSYDELIKDKEIAKLIQYGYDLHQKEMERYVFDVPNFKFYNNNSCPMKVMENGGIFGKRTYPSHSETCLLTILGVCMGKKTKTNFILDNAMMFQVDDRRLKVNFSHLVLEEDDESLGYDLSAQSNEEKIKQIIKALKFIGYNQNDIISVMNKKMTARQAYMNVAPESMKNLRWVNTNRRLFVFDENVAVEGRFGSMDMDKFPFPFEEQPILDCSKVKTACIHFENNNRKIKLINVNSNPESIIYTNLKNAIIEEPIDLSLVDATDTKFGHHTVINLEWSIAQLDKMDLTLAVNENGQRYVVDEKGRVQLDYDCNPKTISSSETKLRNILIFANADNEQMAKDAIENDTDGIGLVRTEHIFTDLKDVKKMVELLDYPSAEIETENLKIIKELQIKQVKEILKANPNHPIVFRLLDFKLKEYLRNFGLTFDDYYDEEYVEYLRGATILYKNPKILTTQIEAIFETLDGMDIDVNLLIPMLRASYEFTDIKKEIMKLSEKYNLKSLKIGAMIENTTMSNDADELAKEADFISIGTNDLTESVTGLSRDSNSIEFQELTYEVKSVIEETIFRARSINPNIIIGICGEHSNYVENVQYYGTQDIDYITCSPAFIKANKEFLNNRLELDSTAKKNKQLTRLKTY